MNRVFSVGDTIPLDGEPLLLVMGWQICSVARTAG